MVRVRWLFAFSSVIREQWENDENERANERSDADAGVDVDADWNDSN